MGGGMLAGHVLSPYGAGAGPARRLLFGVLMLAVGAWRGFRQRRVRADWDARALRPGEGWRAALVGAAGALALAAAGYGVAHG